MSKKEMTPMEALQTLDQLSGLPQVSLPKSIFQQADAAVQALVELCRWAEKHASEEFPPWRPKPAAEPAATPVPATPAEPAKVARGNHSKNEKNSTTDRIVDDVMRVPDAKPN